MGNKGVGVTKKDRAKKIEIEKKKDKHSFPPFDSTLFLIKGAEDRFHSTCYTYSAISGTYIGMKSCSFFKISQYFKHIGWETFVTLDANFI